MLSKVTIRTLLRFMCVSVYFVTGADIGVGIHNVKKSYKLGGRVIITSDDVDAEYAKVADKKTVTREMVLKQMIKIRSTILALKFAKQIPDDSKHLAMNGYEIDQAIYEQFMGMLNKNVSITEDDVAKLQTLYSQITCKKLYVLREFVVPKVHEKNLVIYQGMIQASLDKTAEFDKMAKKHSIAYSAKKGGTIGRYSYEYDDPITSKLKSAKTCDTFIVSEENVSTMYFVEEIIDYKIPDRKIIISNIENEKMNVFTEMLFENYPVEVVEI